MISIQRARQFGFGIGLAASFVVSVRVASAADPAGNVAASEAPVAHWSALTSSRP